jgi:ABC-type multidrug transport system ATPase subunit
MFGLATLLRHLCGSMKNANDVLLYVIAFLSANMIFCGTFFYSQPSRSAIVGSGGWRSLVGLGTLFAMQRPIIYDIESLSKTYPGMEKPANRDISLQIYQGEIFGILGDNGAGKSTLVRQMVNLLSSSAGRIELFGRSISDYPEFVTTQVGYMPQEAQALNNLSVAEALYFTAHLRGMGRHDARQERDRLLSLWGLDTIRERYSSRLSGGQRRLLRLAVAMAGSPPVLILDEPTNDLDPQRRKIVWDILRKMNQDSAVTIIFITHDAIEAEKIIQRVAIMRDGQFGALGRPRQLKQALDSKLRLELFFDPDGKPSLPPGCDYHVVEPGRWMVLLDSEQVGGVMNHLDLKLLDDFRLYSATLEDLYLYYAERP